MARAFLVGVFVLAAIAGTIVVVRHDRHPPTSTTSSPETGEFYQCSMHPQIVSDRPGLGIELDEDAVHRYHVKG